MRSPPASFEFSVEQSESDKDFLNIFNKRAFITFNYDSPLLLSSSVIEDALCLYLTDHFFTRKMAIKQLILMSIPHSIKYVFFVLGKDKDIKDVATVGEQLTLIPPHVNVYARYWESFQYNHHLLRAATPLQEERENQIDSEICNEKEMFATALQGKGAVLANISTFTNKSFQHLRINAASLRVGHLRKLKDLPKEISTIFIEKNCGKEAGTFIANMKKIFSQLPHTIKWLVCDVSNLKLIENILEQLPAHITVYFMGEWSDKSSNNDFDKAIQAAVKFKRQPLPSEKAQEPTKPLYTNDLAGSLLQYFFSIYQSGNYFNFDRDVNIKTKIPNTHIRAIRICKPFFLKKLEAKQAILKNISQYTKYVFCFDTTEEKMEASLLASLPSHVVVYSIPDPRRKRELPEMVKATKLLCPLPLLEIMSNEEVKEQDRLLDQLIVKETAEKKVLSLLLKSKRGDIYDPKSWQDSQFVHVDSFLDFNQNIFMTLPCNIQAIILMGPGPFMANKLKEVKMAFSRLPSTVKWLVYGSWLDCNMRKCFDAIGPHVSVYRCHNLLQENVLQWGSLSGYIHLASKINISDVRYEMIDEEATDEEEEEEVVKIKEEEEAEEPEQREDVVIIDIPPENKKPKQPSANLVLYPIKSEVILEIDEENEEDEEEKNATVEDRNKLRPAFFGGIKHPHESSLAGSSQKKNSAEPAWKKPKQNG